MSLWSGGGGRCPIVRSRSNPVPGGLTPIQLDECLNRRVKTVNPQLLAFAIERWEAAIAECRSP